MELFDLYPPTTLIEKYRMQEKLNLVFNRVVNSYGVTRIKERYPSEITDNELNINIIKNIIMNEEIAFTNKIELLLLTVPEIEKLIDLLKTKIYKNMLNQNEYYKILDFLIYQFFSGEIYDLK